ncbi:phosphodiester glycosidase family protein [Psychrobacter sp. I-STPA10]|uniref:phosphodiester glycosidase family protein n=1 Tax=Psychrobacter sp. I-STPA10 TaxID=2585769 RepID=UPI001E38FDD6|nr:phosphodiester glycosidase family protein [Psychrobacter sp. I-STPA10]
MLLICLFSSGLGGCNDSDPSDWVTSIKDSINSHDHNHSNDNHCDRGNVPFTYSLCQISQDKLLHDKHLSLQLFWKPNNDNSNHDITPLYKFANLISTLPATDKLQFAANAGMYNTEFAPIGYTVIKGKEIRSLNLKQGSGNFHLLPNGVLWWDKSGKVHITESQQMQTLLDDGTATPWYATQSGPMLVIDGHIHPKFNLESTSKKFRNGVGVCDDGYIKFVNSDEPVNFYHFASLFKDKLHCPNALFLDGGIASALYAPEISQHDDKNMGVMVGVVATE